jgi:hypothetical protein
VLYFSGVNYRIDENSRKTFIWDTHDPVAVLKKLREVENSVQIYEFNSK